MSRETARQVLQIEADSITALIERLDESFDEALKLLESCAGRVVTTGMGKSGIICRKIAATLSSTGTPALFLHPAEAIHGDLGMLAAGDVVVMISNGGETAELVHLVKTVQRLDLPLIAMLGAPESAIGGAANVVLDVSVDREACPLGLAPTASTTCALALGDALAMALSQRRGFALEEFARLHPGGKLGKRLALVSDLMHAADKAPSVGTEAPMRDVIYEMSSKGLGMTAVCDDSGVVQGVISDGDLRRLLQESGGKVLESTAAECMTPDPVSIGPDEAAPRALTLLEERKITSLLVTDTDRRLIGVLHIHDLWGTEVF